MKKTTLVLLVFCLLISGCDTYAMVNMYPKDKADVWYCQEIDATIDFSVTNTLWNTNFSWNGQTYICRTSCHASYFFFIFDANSNEILDSPEEKMLEGYWKYKNKNLVIEIINSNLFGDAFTELVFVPVDKESK